MTINLDEIERIARAVPLSDAGPWRVQDVIGDTRVAARQPCGEWTSAHMITAYVDRGDCAGWTFNDDAVAAHIAALDPLTVLEMVAEIRAARDDERIPRLEFRASLAEHQRNDALRRVAELEAHLAASDMAVSDLIDDFDREGLGDAIHDAIRRHRAREGLE